MRVLLAAVLLVACVGCGGGGGPAEPLAIYHLELALGPPGEEGDLRCGPPRTCPGVIQQPAPQEVRYETLAPPGLAADGVDGAAAEALGSTVSVPFTAAGRAAFARLTREVARYGGRDQGWHHLAVVVGDEIVAFPEIDFDAYPDGIPDAPGISISAVDPADARALARRLRGDQEAQRAPDGRAAERGERPARVLRVTSGSSRSRTRRRARRERLPLPPRR